ncbi:hypothetical protein SASPL_136130 [Salvia splendens]|uniref:Uncharacterized protein n=1 Tax=Salvia splendens TaxID=180675 RepID=A0A8X8WZB6_SALSN|nr:hypothetical protein SASPL_136130 [Salvia splendens]
MANRAGYRSEPLGGSIAGATRRLEASSSSTGALDPTALAFEQVLASLARVEVRLDAAERHLIQIGLEGHRIRRGIDRSGMQRQLLLINTNYGLVANIPVATIDHPYRIIWRGSVTAAAEKGVVVDCRLRGTATGHVPPSENEWGWREGEPYSDMQRFDQRRQDQPPPPTRPDPQPPYSDWARERTAWDNPDHRHEIHAGRQSTTWGSPWARHDGGGYSEPHRYDHYRSDRPRYEKMIPPCFDGSDAVNWISRVPVVVGGNPPNRVVSDDERSDPGRYRRIGFFGDKIGGCDKKEFEMALQDRIMEETKDKKNAVEAYVYDMRNKLHDKYHEFVTESDREQLISRLQEVEDWLYEDGEDETKGVYIAKLDELKKQVDPIEERFKEHSERGTVLSDCVEAEAWLREKQQHQDTLPKYTTPVLLSAEVRKKAESLDRSCRPIMMKPKPAAKPFTPEPVPTERGMEVVSDEEDDEDKIWEEEQVRKGLGKWPDDGVGIQGAGSPVGGLSRLPPSGMHHPTQNVDGRSCYNNVGGVSFDMFGQDVNLRKWMDITRRSEARRVKADSKRKLAMEPFLVFFNIKP